MRKKGHICSGRASPLSMKFIGRGNASSPLQKNLIQTINPLNGTNKISILSGPPPGHPLKSVPGVGQIWPGGGPKKFSARYARQIIIIMTAF